VNFSKKTRDIPQPDFGDLFSSKKKKQKAKKHVKREKRKGRKGKSNSSFPEANILSQPKIKRNGVISALPFLLVLDNFPDRKQTISKFTALSQNPTYPLTSNAPSLDIYPDPN